MFFLLEFGNYLTSELMYSARSFMSYSFSMSCAEEKGFSAFFAQIHAESSMNNVTGAFHV